MKRYEKKMKSVIDPKLGSGIEEPRLFWSAPVKSENMSKKGKKGPEPGSEEEQLVVSNQGKTLFVSGIPLAIQRKALQAFFSQFGVIEKLYLRYRDEASLREGQTVTTFATVTFANKRAVGLFVAQKVSSRLLTVY